MKVLFLSGVETAGGGSVAAARLANGLTENGVEVLCFYNKRVSSPFGEPRRWSSRLVGLPRALDVLNNGLRRASAPLARQLGRLYSNVALSGELRRTTFDLLHVHVIHNSFWDFSTLQQIPADVPVVWTFHDCWAFSPEAQRFTDLEGHQVRLRPANGDPAEAMRVRRRYFSSRRFCRLASNSTRVAELARAALDLPVVPLGCGLDLERFRPLDKLACRRALGIADGTFVMLCIADNLRDPVKGFAVLERALAGSRLGDALLLSVGAEEVSESSIGQVRFRQLGRLYNPDLLALIYSAADVFVMPSLAEALGLVGMESVACGTPVVASNVQGIPDVVRQGETGYLVPPADPLALRQRLEEVRASPALLSGLASTCRRFAVANFGYKENARRYLALYRDLLAQVGAAGNGSAG